MVEIRRQEAVEAARQERLEGMRKSDVVGIAAGISFKLPTRTPSLSVLTPYLPWRWRARPILDRAMQSTVCGDVGGKQRQASLRLRDARPQRPRQ